DYILKPFDPAELCARVRVGQRLLQLQQTLAERVRELEEMQAKVEQLQELLPICCYCKSIRKDEDYWQQVDHYLTERWSSLQFSHGICPDCYDRVVTPQIEAARRCSSRKG